MTRYIRPLVQVGPARPDTAQPLAGGWGWFTDVEILSRNDAPYIAPVSELTEDELSRLTKPHEAIAGLSFNLPIIMGILNVTPDSFSDGGQHSDPRGAVAKAEKMVTQGATLIDIGGESTRPGAAFVTAEDEIDRTVPVINALRESGFKTPISIDTRKGAVAQAALNAGVDIVNDVSGFTFDPALAPLCAARNVPVCVMHAQGDPATMQESPRYENVILDVYDFLEERIDALVTAGIPRRSIIADPGIGFGKTQEHNLEILNRISLFHSLGVPVLLGASRKRFIGTIGKAEQADKRAPGSIGVALAAISQGIQLVRVHDVESHAQAIALWLSSVALNHYER